MPDTPTMTSVEAYANIPSSAADSCYRTLAFCVTPYFLKGLGQRGFLSHRKGYATRENAIGRRRRHLRHSRTRWSLRPSAGDRDSSPTPERRTRDRRRLRVPAFTRGRGGRDPFCVRARTHESVRSPGGARS